MRARPLSYALLAVVLMLAASAQAGRVIDRGATAFFRYVETTPLDPATTQPPPSPTSFRNPILPGFHPDPSIVRVGGDYYLVNSSFGYYPGLPIFHSRDLVHWTQIGNAIDRPNTLNFNGHGIDRALFAPTIRHHDGLFYFINTCIECGFNYMITAKNPAGPWSNPIFLPQVDGIDPDLFFDDDGRVWIASNGTPIEPPLYSGHRAIWLQEYDRNSQKIVGVRTLLVNGGVHIADKPVWVEGPHLYKKDGYYYLMAAEGGTSDTHSETIYRATSVTGPYVAGPVNPILTQRDLDPARPQPVYATGHADLVQTKAGDWWAVFLGTRPYKRNLSNMGRETFLLPVTWKDGWPQILPPRTPLPAELPKPGGVTEASEPVKAKLLSTSETFRQNTLPPAWLMLRTPKVTWYHLKNGLAIDARSETLGGTENPSFLGVRQTQSVQTVATELRYVPSKDGDEAGLAIFADETHFYTFGIMKAATSTQLVVKKRENANDPEGGRIVAHAPLRERPGAPIRLVVTLNDANVDFAYSFGSKHEAVAPHRLLSNADGQFLASEQSNKFMGVVIGPYATRAKAR